MGCLAIFIREFAQKSRLILHLQQKDEELGIHLLACLAPSKVKASGMIYICDRGKGWRGRRNVPKGEGDEWFIMYETEEGKTEFS